MGIPLNGIPVLAHLLNRHQAQRAAEQEQKRDPQQKVALIAGGRSGCVAGIVQGGNFHRSLFIAADAAFLMLHAGSAYLSFLGDYPDERMLIHIGLVSTVTFMPVVRFIRLSGLAIGVADCVDVGKGCGLFGRPTLFKDSGIGGFPVFRTSGGLGLLSGDRCLSCFHVAVIVLTDPGCRAGFAVTTPHIGGSVPIVTDGGNVRDLFGVGVSSAMCRLRHRKSC